MPAYSVLNLNNVFNISTVGPKFGGMCLILGGFGAYTSALATAVFINSIKSSADFELSNPRGIPRSFIRLWRFFGFCCAILYRISSFRTRRLGIFFSIARFSLQAAAAFSAAR